MKIKTQHGFTLIELVVVIAILGILAGIAIPRFIDAQATARGSKILADMRTLESALTIYNIKNPITTTGAIEITILTSGSNPVIASVPKPPVGRALFPKGYELDVDKSYKYQIYHHATGATFIILNVGQVLTSMDINFLTTATEKD